MVHFAQMAQLMAENVVDQRGWQLDGEGIQRDDAASRAAAPGAAQDPMPESDRLPCPPGNGGSPHLEPLLKPGFGFPAIPLEQLISHRSFTQIRVLQLQQARFVLALDRRRAHRQAQCPALSQIQVLAAIVVSQGRRWCRARGLLALLALDPVQSLKQHGLDHALWKPGWCPYPNALIAVDFDADAASPGRAEELVIELGGKALEGRLALRHGELSDLLELRPEGLYCPAAGIYIDAWRPVDRTIITHAHSDHARQGHQSYLCAPACLPILQHRLGNLRVQTLAEGQSLRVGGARISLHPAGHILGATQVRIEVSGRVAVVTGDYKRQADPTCAPFEPVICDVLVTEATFALPVYHWAPTAVVVADIVRWWQRCKSEGLNAVLFAYALGKAQRLLAELRALIDEPVIVHGAVASINRLYEAQGVALAPDAAPPVSGKLKGRLVIAPPSAAGSAWLKRFQPCETGYCSGWMQVRGARRRRGHERGFILSDHADWPALLQTIRDSQASLVLPTHGNCEALVRLLGEQGVRASPLAVTREAPSDDGLPREMDA